MTASSSDTASTTRSITETCRRSSSSRKESESRGAGRVAGVDVAYRDDRYRSALAVFVDGRLVKIEEDRGLSYDRYVSTLFFLKEAPVVSRLIYGRDLDLLFVNGHGVCHPHGFGLATVVGITHKVRTIGIAQRLIKGDYGRKVSSYKGIEFITQSGLPTGAAVRRTPGGNEIFVSPGYGVSLAEAVAEYLGWLRTGKLPEPLRLAHLRSREMKRAEEEGKRTKDA